MKIQDKIKFIELKEQVEELKKQLETGKILLRNIDGYIEILERDPNKKVDALYILKEIRSRIEKEQP